MRLEQAAPIAGALVDRDHLGGRHLFEIIEAEGGLTVRGFATDRQPPFGGVDLGNVGQVVADEKRIVRRQRGAEILERRFIVRRPVRELDQRLLAGQRVHDDLAARALRQGRRQVGHRRLGFDQAWKNRVAAGERDGRTCCLE